MLSTVNASLTFLDYKTYVLLDHHKAAKPFSKCFIIDLPKRSTDLQDGNFEDELDWTSLRIDALQNKKQKVNHVI